MVGRAKDILRAGKAGEGTTFDHLRGLKQGYFELRGGRVS